MCLLPPSDHVIVDGPRSGFNYAKCDGGWWIYYHSGAPETRGCLKREPVTLPELIEILDEILQLEIE